ncbi:hypothetical protein HMPREF0762_00629 [Slackia exigua ATCC 700122]|uniref:Uncharacterized protein n=1 Tax=Slackia exigua (strain ATCC 700122 / DSM 15923 / CIP 105133 / JCM 11022 / KCTC 5966 / S-7) TaxID=649764 RepID=D0WFN0_SLAES|nr:hypothetical protein HMPREF0762_00629 [Slackia exigua ATCC 700122]
MASSGTARPSAPLPRNSSPPHPLGSGRAEFPARVLRLARFTHLPHAEPTLPKPLARSSAPACIHRLSRRVQMCRAYACKPSETSQESDKTVALCTFLEDAVRISLCMN